jgi:cellulose synthase/poly-beta-1,6-N-acetylglucosamine synthase-like glycosyltransferase
MDGSSYYGAGAEVLWFVLGLSAVFLAYTYAGYPLLAVLLGRIARRPHRPAPIEPKVSLVILAHNEERSIGAKLENALALDYPREKLEVVVGSDGSTDRTDEIVSGFSGSSVRLFRADGRPGKTETTNRVVPTTSGEILIFSDATGKYDSQAIRTLVRHFANPAVGAVSGRVVYSYGRSTLAGGFKAYQRLTFPVRVAESAFGTETSVSGSITALRRELFRPIPADLDFDMAHPLHVAMEGYRTLYDAEAESLEEAREKGTSEFAARVRMAIFAFSFLPYLLRRLGRCKSRIYVFQVLSHKVLRWLSPFFLIAILLTSALLALDSTLALLALLAQVIFYGLAALGWQLQGSMIGTRLLGIPVFFTTINLAFLAGALRWLRGARSHVWKPER